MPHCSMEQNILSPWYDQPLDPILVQVWKSCELQRLTTKVDKYWSEQQNHLLRFPRTRSCLDRRTSPTKPFCCDHPINFRSPTRDATKFGERIGRMRIDCQQPFA